MIFIKFTNFNIDKNPKKIVPFITWNDLHMKAYTSTCQEDRTTFKSQIHMKAVQMDDNSCNVLLISNLRMGGRAHIHIQRQQMKLTSCQNPCRSSVNTRLKISFNSTYSKMLQLMQFWWRQPVMIVAIEPIEKFT